MLKKRIFLTTFILFLATFLLTGCQAPSTNNTNSQDSPSNISEDNKAEAIKNLFVAKYGKKAEDISLTFSQETDDFARGGVKFSQPGGEGPGGNFLAAKVDGQWKLVFDGNGGFACSELQKYNFPEEMVVGCYIPTPVTKDYFNEAWKNYHNEKFGYTVSYPESLSLMADDEDVGLDILGPTISGQHWPKISLIHPSDSYYRPSLGTDVIEWVKMSPGFELGSAVQIAALPTVHFVQPKTAQAQAADYYYFIKGEQLYKIVFYHLTGKQDQDLATKFLESFKFDK